MSERTDTIRLILAKHGKLNGSADTIEDDKSLYSAGLTSHASVNVMLALEDEFDIEFPERLLTRSTFETVGNLRDAVDSLLGEES
ncbi:MAG: Aminoacyl carrier protein [Ilumatobacteraceae bacterium]|nr:Aminoacyl carrier protein [Ilumatobacteraceae bacterium]